MKCATETINCIVIHIGVNRSAQAQSIKHTIITCTSSSERITEVKLINGLYVHPRKRRS